MVAPYFGMETATQSHVFGVESFDEMEEEAGGVIWDGFFGQAELRGKW